MNHEIRHNMDHIHPDHFERAEALISKLPPETQHRYHGSIGAKNGQSARASGLERETRRANDDLIDIESEENTRHSILRHQNAEMTDEERERLSGRKERKQRQIEALTSASSVAAKEASAARDVAYRMVLYVSGVAADGEVLKPKSVKLGRSPYENQLAANPEEQSNLKREFERIRNAEPPIEVYQQQVLRRLEERQGDPFAITYFGGEATLKESVRAIDAASTSPGHVVTAPDPLPMLLALFGDEIRGRLLARIARDHKDDNTLRIEAGEKRRLLTDLRARILELQYVEGALLTAIAGPGALEIPFRKGMDPRAVLGVTGPAPKPL